MNLRANTRLIMALLLLLTVFMSFSVSFAQDEGGDTSTEPAGVGEIAKAADNFNVSAVPTQEQAKSVLNTSPVSSAFDKAVANFDVEAVVRADGHGIFSSIVEPEPPNLDRNAKRTPAGQTPSGDVLMRVDDPSGAVLTVFTDYSLVAADAKGEVFFQGYIAGQSAASLMIVGKNSKGTQYALSHGDAIGLNTGGDVFFSIDKHWYLYDYNEAGNFVGLIDNDSHKYAVETAANGDTTITDAAGDIGDFNLDGSYDIKNPAGDVLDQGALFGPNDGDATLTPDLGGEATLAPGAEATESSLDASTSNQGEATSAPDTSGDSGAATESPDANTGATTGG